MTILHVERFTSFNVAADGERISLECIDRCGAASSIIIHRDHLKEMMMTLPEIARQSLARAYGDPSLRLVYPLAAWELEAGADGRLVLTLRTPDRFQIAFAMALEAIDEIAAAARNNMAGLTRLS